MLNWARERFGISSTPKAQALNAFDPGLWRMLGGGPTESGQDITPANVMSKSPTVYAAVSAISQAIAQLPLYLMHWDDSEEAVEHPLASLLTNAPNPWTTAADFREKLMLDVLLWGNGLAYIQRDKDGAVLELHHMEASATSIERLPGELEPTYRFTRNDGKQIVLPRENVFHIKTGGHYNYRGDSPILLHRNSIALEAIMIEHVARLFSNGARHSGYLSHPQKLTKDIVDRLKEQIAEYSGKNSGKTMILEEGMDFKSSTFSSVDSQTLELRRHQVGEIARIYRVALPLVGDLERSTHQNAEIMGRQFLQYTLQPWVRKWEQAISLFLLAPGERRKYYARFDVGDFNRADTAQRYAAYVQAISNGIYSPNEVRSMEDLPPYDGGDDFRQPLNQGAAQTSRVDKSRVEARLMALENYLKSRPLLIHERT